MNNHSIWSSYLSALSLFNRTNWNEMNFSFHFFSFLSNIGIHLNCTNTSALAIECVCVCALNWCNFFSYRFLWIEKRKYKKSVSVHVIQLMSLFLGFHCIPHRMMSIQIEQAERTKWISSLKVDLMHFSSFHSQLRAQISFNLLHLRPFRSKCAFSCVAFSNYFSSLFFALFSMKIAKRL